MRFFNRRKENVKWYCTYDNEAKGFIYIRTKTKRQAKRLLGCCFCDQYKKRCKGPTRTPKRKEIL